MQTSDCRLVQAALAGDREACAELVGRYSRAAYGRAYEVTENRHDAEDLVQEAFLRAFQALGSLREAERFGAWFHALLGNICRDWLRRQKVRRPTYHAAELSRVQLDEPGRVESPSAKALDSGEELRRAVARLPEAFRSVLLLRYGQELSYEELARFLGLSKELVGVRIVRAKQRLRMMLKGKQEV